MSESELNLHEAAIAELEQWEADDIRHAFDTEAIVLADLHPSKFEKEQKNEENN